MEAQRLRRRQDHRLQRLVHDTGNVQLAVRHGVPRYGVPRSTARDWSRLPGTDVVTLDVTAMSEFALQREVLELRARHVPEELAERRKAARADRIVTNRSTSCGVCAVEAVT